MTSSVSLPINISTGSLVEYMVRVSSKLLVEMQLQKLSKVHSNGFKRSVYWSECRTKRENGNTTNECRFFLKSNFVGVKDCL